MLRMNNALWPTNGRPPFIGSPKVPGCIASLTIKTPVHRRPRPPGKARLPAARRREALPGFQADVHAEHLVKKIALGRQRMLLERQIVFARNGQH